MADTDTETVRAVYCWNSLEDRYDPSFGPEFDRWLAGVQADAWDAGAMSAFRDKSYGNDDKFWDTNPYRKDV